MPLQAVRDTQSALLGPEPPDHVVGNQSADCAQLSSVRVLAGRQPNRRRMFALTGWARKVLGEDIAVDLVREAHELVEQYRSEGKQL